MYCKGLAILQTENEMDFNLSLSQFSGTTTSITSAWIKVRDQYRPSYDMVQRLQQEVILAKPDAQATLHINQHYFVRYQKKLYRLTHDILYAENNHPLQMCRY